jgi:hypothetical protein
MPCGSRCDGLFKFLGEAMIAVQPGEGSLDDSASRENGKPFAAPDRLTISVVHLPIRPSASLSLSPA